MSKYNPNIHHRRSIRLKGYDYSQEGLYFITICCQDRKHRFGNIENGKMILNEYGEIAHNEWIKLKDRFPNFELDVFQIMPNHMHSIIALVPAEAEGAGFTPAQYKVEEKEKEPEKEPENDIIKSVNGKFVDDNGESENDLIGFEIGQPQGIAPTGVSDIVGAYKSLVANGCLKIYKLKNKTMGKLWQRNYYEHILRNDRSYQNISEYIIDNPLKWMEDKFHTS